VTVQVFPHVYMLDVDEDVNRVLFALSTPAEGDTINNNNNSNSTSKNSNDSNNGDMDLKALKLGAVRLVAAASKYQAWGGGPLL